MHTHCASFSLAGVACIGLCTRVFYLRLACIFCTCGARVEYPPAASVLLFASGKRVGRVSHLSFFATLPGRRLCFKKNKGKWNIETHLA